MYGFHVVVKSTKRPMDPSWDITMHYDYMWVCWYLGFMDRSMDTQNGPHI